ncbi:MAG: zinc ribbon domain-containing protein [Dehalococcoidales bacterium]
MTVFIAILLTILTFAFIAYPFFKQKWRLVDSAGGEKLRELHSRRDVTYSMLKELEFDLQSGILTEEDYQDLEARYKRKAISILREMDKSEKGSDVDEEIEKQVLELRRSKGRFCPQCGNKYQENDRFCSRCGINLSKGEAV